jgi:hypothetical protein
MTNTDHNNVMYILKKYNFHRKILKSPCVTLDPEEMIFFIFFVKKTSHLNFTTHHWALSLEVHLYLCVVGGVIFCLHF